MLRYKYKHRSEKYWSFNKYSKVIIEISIVLIKAVELRYFRLCAEEEGFLREQAPDFTPHPIPAQAGYRGNIYSPQFLRRAEFINIDSVLQKKSEGTEDGSSLSGETHNEPSWGNPGEED